MRDQIKCDIRAYWLVCEEIQQFSATDVSKRNICLLKGNSKVYLTHPRGFSQLIQLFIAVNTYILSTFKR